MRFYVTSRCRTLAEDEENLKPPEELFGKNVEFIMARVYAGRPNWNFLFNYWSSLYKRYDKFLFLFGRHDIELLKQFRSNFVNRKPVSVYSCGPKSLNKDVKKVCEAYNKKGFQFRFLHEAFS